MLERGFAESVEEILAASFEDGESCDYHVTKDCSHWTNYVIMFERCHVISVLPNPNTLTHTLTLLYPHTPTPTPSLLHPHTPTPTPSLPHPHTPTPSHLHTPTPSHPHTPTPLHAHTPTPSHPHTPTPTASTSKPQLLLFSATVPEWVLETAERYMTEDRVVVDLIGGETMRTATGVQHYALCCPYTERPSTIADIIQVDVPSGMLG